MNIVLTVVHIICIVLDVIHEEYVTAMWCLSSLVWFLRAKATEFNKKKQRG